MGKVRLKMLGSRVAEAPARVRAMPAPSWRTGKKTVERGYDARWKRFREQWLRLHPLCGDREEGRSAEHSACARAGRAVAATVVDHVEPHRGDMQAFWSGSFQSLCASCHSSLKQAQEAAQP